LAAGVSILALAGGLALFGPRPGSEPALEAGAVTGKVTLATRPPGARVSVDGTARGAAPLELELAAGAHDVTLSLPGYHDLEATLDVPAGQQVPIELELMPQEGTP
jgi:hypothetical protein